MPNAALFILLSIGEVMQVENDNHQQRVENYIEYRLKEGNINSGWVLFHTQIFHFWDTARKTCGGIGLANNLSLVAVR